MTKRIIVINKDRVIRQLFLLSAHYRNKKENFDKLNVLTTDNLEEGRQFVEKYKDDNNSFFVLGFDLKNQQTSAKLVRELKEKGNFILFSPNVDFLKHTLNDERIINRLRSKTHLKTILYELIEEIPKFIGLSNFMQGNLFVLVPHLVENGFFLRMLDKKEFKEILVTEPNNIFSFRVFLDSNDKIASKLKYIKHDFNTIIVDSISLKQIITDFCSNLNVNVKLFKPDLNDQLVSNSLIISYTQSIYPLNLFIDVYLSYELRRYFNPYPLMGLFLEQLMR